MDVLLKWVLEITATDDIVCHSVWLVGIKYFT